MNRREALIKIGIMVGGAVVLSNVGCDEIAPTRVETQLIRLEDLIGDPSRFLDKKIKVNGYPEYAGETNYFIPYPYFDTTTNMTTTSLSVVILTTHKLHTAPDLNSPFFLATEQHGGYFLPLPVVAVPGDKDQGRGLFEVSGTIRKDQEQKYLMEIQASKSLSHSPDKPY